MLDQNTDRLWYTIGVVIVAAGIFAGILIFMPDFISSIASTADGFNVEYQLNGGTSDMNKRFLAVRDEHTVPLEEPKLESYHFQGWLAIDTDEIVDGTDFTVLTKADGDVYLPGQTFEPQGHTTMVALWRMRENDVSYNLNGGTGEFPLVKVPYESTHTIPTHKPTRTGYTFHGWINSDTLTTLQPGNSFKPEGDVELKATWTLNKYMVTYNLDGGSGAFTNAEVQHGNGHTIPNLRPTKTGYTFDGWVDNDGKRHAQGAVIAIEKPTTLKAVWVVNKYSVSYILNGGSGTFNNVTLDYGSTYTIPTTPPTRSGYLFLGWERLNTDGTVMNVVHPGQTLTISGPEKLSAKWSIKYDITFNVNGGTGTYTGATVSHGDSYQIPANKPTRYGFTFEGWRRANGTIVQAGETIGVTSHEPLVATWKVETPTVRYDSNNGTPIAGGYFTTTPGPEVVTPGITYTNYDVPNMERYGYTFQGWRNSVTGELFKPPYATANDIAVRFTMPNESVTMVAVFTKTESSPTVQYNGNGGSPFDYGGSAFLPSQRTVAIGAWYGVDVPNMSKDGYTFVGWSAVIAGEARLFKPLSTSSGDVTVSFTMPNHSITMEAIYTKD